MPVATLGRWAFGQGVSPLAPHLICFRGRLRMARSSQAEGHARWGTALFGDHFGTTESGGLVVYVNGALVRRQKNDWQ